QPAMVGTEILHLEDEEIRPGAERLESEDQEIPVVVHAAPMSVNQHPQGQRRLCDPQRRPTVQRKVVGHDYFPDRTAATSTSKPFNKADLTRLPRPARA